MGGGRKENSLEEIFTWWCDEILGASLDQ